jgi:arylformamidase
MMKSPAPRLVDLSHVIEHGMITYRGLPAPVVCDYLTREQSRALYAPGTDFHIGRIDMVANNPGRRARPTRTASSGCSSSCARRPYPLGVPSSRSKWARTTR